MATYRNYIFAAGVLAADQLSKYLVGLFVPAGRKVSVISTYLEICHVKNSGIIFGIGGGWGQDHRYLMTAVVLATAGLSLALMWAYKERLRSKNHLTSIIFPLFIGGSLGNFTDRLFKGSVADWINSSLFTGPTNIADIAVFSAIFLFIIGVVRGGTENTASGQNTVENQIGHQQGNHAL